jgi:hypothetical protein
VVDPTDAGFGSLWITAVVLLVAVALLLSLPGIRRID